MGIVSLPPLDRHDYLTGLLELVEQRERRERDLPVASTVARLPHRAVVRERNPGHPRRLDPILHGQRHRRYPPPLYGVADQPDGPVAQRSRGR